MPLKKAVLWSSRSWAAPFELPQARLPGDLFRARFLEIPRPRPGIREGLVKGLVCT